MHDIKGVTVILDEAGAGRRFGLSTPKRQKNGGKRNLAKRGLTAASARVGKCGKCRATRRRCARGIKEKQAKEATSSTRVLRQAGT